MRLLWIAVVLLGCVDERAVVQDDPLADPGLDALVGRVGVDAGGARRPPAPPDPPPPEPPPPEPPDPPPPEPGVRWFRCDEADACAVLPMPLDHDRPQGPVLDYFVRRFDAYDRSTRQLWLIQGGPGAPGDGVADLAYLFREVDPSLTVYVPDHRGTGRSSWLGCPDDLRVGPACQRSLLATWGSAVRQFSATQAARDLGAAIDLLAGPREEVLVWGVSYGTVLVNRYAHLFPGQADALLYDSACPGAGCDLSAWDPNFDRIGRAYLAGCAADAGCRAALGPDPVEALTGLLASLEEGHCRVGIQPVDLKAYLAFFLMDEGTRAAIPALVQRLQRCNDRDRAALGWFQQTVAGLFDETDPPPGDSDAVYWNIAISELWSPADPRPEVLAARDARLLFTTGSVGELARFVAAWQPPRYVVDARHRRWATPPVPMLLLNGTLDPQTPHFQLDDAVAAFTGPGQHVRFLEGGAHAVIDFPFDAGSPCGALITGAFVVDPAAPLRDGCADALGPPGYTLDAELADLLFHDGAGKRGGATAWWPRLRARFLALPPPVRHALSRRAP